jgi:hypothetical protein
MFSYPNLFSQRFRRQSVSFAQTILLIRQCVTSLVLPFFIQFQQPTGVHCSQLFVLVQQESSESANTTVEDEDVKGRSTHLY